MACLPARPSVICLSVMGPKLTQETFSFQMSHQLLFLMISIDDPALVGSEEAEWGTSLGC